MYTADNFDPIPREQPIAHYPNVLQHPATHVNSTPHEQLPEHFRTPAHIDPHEPAHPEPYTAKELADHFDVQDVTVRTRWYPHLLKVCPEHRLRSGKGYSRLSWDLFTDFYQNVKRGGMLPETWIQEARKRFDFGVSEVVDCELLPEEVGGQLALANNKLAKLQQEGNTNKEKLLEFIEAAKSTRANLSATEIETAKERGKNRAIAKFQTELSAELETEAMLRKMMTE